MKGPLLEKLKALFEGVSLKQLQKPVSDLIKYYKTGKKVPFKKEPLLPLAYLAYRFPATFAVVQRVSKEFPEEPIASILDVGAGSGAATLAFIEAFPSVKIATLMEKESALFPYGESLLPPFAKYLPKDVTKTRTFPQSDLVVASYSLGEIPMEKVTVLLKQMWKAATKFLLIVEPGTPSGFENIRAYRKQLIQLGGHMVAPCPHIDACPMKGGDWCHFSTRVARNAIHKKAKNVSLTYEDEKYSYVLFAKEVYPLPEARILRPPKRGEEALEFTLCARNGVKKKSVNRKDKEEFPLFRNKKWGDRV